MIEAATKNFKPQTGHGLAWKAKTISLPAVAWIDRGLPARMLHIFRHACNLINDDGEILSIVSGKVGQAPFAIEVDTDKRTNWGYTGFQGWVDTSSEISFQDNWLIISDYPIDISDAELWDPKLNLESLYKKRGSIFRSLPRLMAILNSPLFSETCAGILGHVLPEEIDRSMRHDRDLSHGFYSAMIQPARSLCCGLAREDLVLSQESARRLVGLGPGLTPAGDDFIMGAILGAHFSGHQELASQLLEGIAGELAGRTNALSMAFLCCASRGEASIAWHDLRDALIIGSGSQLTGACYRILRSGHSSGADALAGFIAVTAWLEWRGLND